MLDNSVKVEKYLEQGNFRGTCLNFRMDVRQDDVLRNIPYGDTRS